MSPLVKYVLFKTTLMMVTIFVAFWLIGMLGCANREVPPTVFPSYKPNFTVGQCISVNNGPPDLIIKVTNDSYIFSRTFTGRKFPFVYFFYPIKMINEQGKLGKCPKI